ncbi:glycoside hydrolase domain-containing protein, partial [Phocaeicola plebeius]
KTQQYVSQIMDELYLNTPAGLCGNEDCGQMSAWYVFSAMGFYPVNPVSGEYEIGKPKFKKVELQLANGKVFTVVAKNLDKENRYIRAVKLNGKDYHQSFITHGQILSGATLELEMCNDSGHIWY